MKRGKISPQKVMIVGLIISLLAASGEGSHLGIGGDADGKGEVPMAGCTCHSAQPDNSVTIILDGVPYHYQQGKEYQMKIQIIGGPEINSESYTGGFSMKASLGQFTPGPVLTTATFIGYQLQGLTGALYSSVGMFLPSFIFVAILVRIIPFIKKSKVLNFMLGFVNAGAVGIMIAVTLKLSYNFLFDWKYCTIMVLSIVVAYFFKKISSIWIVFGGAAIGYILHILV